MAKYINTRTGQEVPANEVRELAPGSGLYVHVVTRAKSRVVSTPGRGSGPGIPIPGVGVFYPDGDTVVTDVVSTSIDGYVAVIGDNATYNPATDNPLNKIAERNRSGG